MNKYGHVNIGTFFFRKDAWPNDFMRLEFELPNDTQGPTFYNQGLVFFIQEEKVYDCGQTITLHTL